MSGFETYVWAVGNEFGYLIVNEDNGDIVRKKAASLNSHWLREVRNLVGMEVALNARAEVHGVEGENPQRKPYKLYVASKTAVAPMCFPSLMHWLWYCDANVGGRRRKESFCSDCSVEHQAKMIREDRCGRPELDLADEKFVAIPSLPKKRGRPRKNVA